MITARHPRLFATCFLLVFAACGFLVFRGRLSRDVTLRLELPPFVRDRADTRVLREQFGRLSGTISAADGVVTSTFEVLANDSPLAGPVMLRLRDGAYQAEVRLPDVPSSHALLGRFEVDGDGEARLELRPIP